jgi:hypothetical protein
MALSRATIFPNMPEAGIAQTRTKADQDQERHPHCASQAWSRELGLRAGRAAAAAPLRSAVGRA